MKTMTDQSVLHNIRILDFTWVLAGPYATRLLADFGAEVIKVQPLMPEADSKFARGYYNMWNRNKLSITLDISKDEGVNLAKELVRRSDIVIENFSPGAMDRRGLDYASLAGIKPDIIMVSLSPMGQHGPLSRLVTYAPIISALSGIDSMVGYPGQTPLGFKHAYGDPTSSLFGVFALLSALRYRKRTGKGQYIDLAESECVTSMMAEAILDYQMNGRVQGPMGNRSDIMAPHGNYPCRETDTWVSIAIKTETEWQAFCKTMGNPPWTKYPEFADKYARIQNSAELDKRVSEWTAKRGAYEAAQRLQKAGVAAAPVLAISEIFVDPHINARHTFASVDHPVTGGTAIYDLPWKIKGVKRKPLRHAPLLGESNDYVLGKIIGLAREEIDKLVASQVVY